MTVLLSSLSGESTVVEGVSEDRFRYVEELIKMGACIEFTKKQAKIKGTDKLKGTVAVSYTHLDVYKRQVSIARVLLPPAGGRRKAP